jgi:hypothetical protein
MTSNQLKAPHCLTAHRTAQGLGESHAGPFRFPRQAAIVVQIRAMAWRKAGARVSADRRKALLREIADKRAELDLISAQKITNDFDEVQRTLRGKIKELRLELEGMNRDASRS